MNSNRIDTHLQILFTRTMGHKPSKTLTILYNPSGEQPEYNMLISNHYLYDGIANETGKITFTVNDSYLQDKLYIKQYLATDSNGYGMDTTPDDSYSLFHNYSCNSIVSGGIRYFYLMFDGEELSFDNLMGIINYDYPTE